MWTQVLNRNLKLKIYKVHFIHYLMILIQCYYLVSIFFTFYKNSFFLRKILRFKKTRTENHGDQRKLMKVFFLGFKEDLFYFSNKILKKDFYFSLIFKILLCYSQLISPMWLIKCQIYILSSNLYNPSLRTCPPQLCYV